MPRRNHLIHHLGIVLALAAQPGCTTLRGAQVAPAGSPRWGLVLHGGAGNIDPSMLTPERQAEYRAALEEGLRAGHRVLARGGSSVDAVEAAITVLEDSPLF